MKVPSELAQDRRAWSTSARDVVNLDGDAGSTRPGSMPPEVQVHPILRPQPHSQILEKNVVMLSAKEPRD